MARPAIRGLEAVNISLDAVVYADKYDLRGSERLDGAIIAILISMGMSIMHCMSYLGFSYMVLVSMINSHGDQLLDRM